MPASAGGPLPAPQAQLTLRDDTAGSGAARVPGKNFEHEPMIALSPYLVGPAAAHRTGPAVASCPPPRARALRVLPAPDRRDRSCPTWTYAGRSAAPPAAAGSHRTGLTECRPPPARRSRPRSSRDPAEIRSRPASTTQETIVNTDIHGAGRSDIWSDGTSTAACACSCPPGGQLPDRSPDPDAVAGDPGHDPDSGGNAPTRSSPTPTPRPSSRASEMDLTIMALKNSRVPSAASTVVHAVPRCSGSRTSACHVHAVAGTSSSHHRLRRCRGWATSRAR